ncbi:MAG: hypothetical protein ACJASB_000550 [Shewanella psychromarinicola]|jgi:hypothetical protein
MVLSGGGADIGKVSLGLFIMKEYNERHTINVMTLIA